MARLNDDFQEELGIIDRNYFFCVFLNSQSPELWNKNHFSGGNYKTYVEITQIYTFLQRKCKTLYFVNKLPKEIMFFYSN